MAELPVVCTLSPEALHARREGLLQHLMYAVSGVTNPPPGASMKGRFVDAAVRQDGRRVLASSAASGTP